jgi:hypothetical protein
MASKQVLRRVALKELAAEAAGRLTQRRNGPLDLFQIRFDVRVTLRFSIMAQEGLPHTSLKETWKPADAGLDGQGWAMILADFARDLRNLRSGYKPYAHQPRFTADTLSKPLSETDDYLVAKVVATLSAAAGTAGS